MADMTRAQHIARAESLAGRAHEMHRYLEDGPPSDEDGRTIAQMHALAQLATAYAALAGVAGQQPAEPPMHLHVEGQACPACFVGQSGDVS